MGFQHAVHNVLGWLRRGYPQGVPASDYIALLGILRHRLTDAEVEYVALEVAKSSSEPISAEQIRDTLRSLTLQQANPQDVARVSALLAGAGWPLAGIDETAADQTAADPSSVSDEEGALEESPDSVADRPGDPEAEADAVTAADDGTPDGKPADGKASDGGGKGNPVRRFVEWIRLGYPAGIPPQDYPPLLALLQRRLPDEEVDAVCNALLLAGIVPANRTDVGVEISKSVNALPTEEEIDRVVERLSAVGWPVADPR